VPVSSSRKFSGGTYGAIRSKRIKSGKRLLHKIKENITAKLPKNTCAFHALAGF
jgi:hypothetical protein